MRRIGEAGFRYFAHFPAFQAGAGQHLRVGCYARQELLLPSVLDVGRPRGVLSPFLGGLRVAWLAVN